MKVFKLNLVFRKAGRLLRDGRFVGSGQIGQTRMMLNGEVLLGIGMFPRSVRLVSYQADSEGQPAAG